MLENRHIPVEYTDKLMDVKETESNIGIESDLSVFHLKTKMYLKIVSQLSFQY